MVNHCELLGRYTAAQAQELMAVHSDLVRDQLYDTGGFEVKFLGDGFMLAFPSARGAVRCAAGVQRALADHNRLNGDTGLSVRVGINTGDAVCEDDDFFGLAVSLAARVMAKARGGQILLTELTRGLAGSCTGVSFLDRGRHRVKGFPGRHRLFEVEWSGQAF
jgi:adenylate cyclase